MTGTFVEGSTSTLVMARVYSMQPSPTARIDCRTKGGVFVHAFHQPQKDSRRWCAVQLTVVRSKFTSCGRIASLTFSACGNWQPFATRSGSWRTGSPPLCLPNVFVKRNALTRSVGSPRDKCRCVASRVNKVCSPAVFQNGFRRLIVLLINYRTR